jgi:predicted CXXCH cytochrome family protein
MIGGQTVTVANDSCSVWQDANGNYHYAAPYQPVNVAATALCIECHRQERNNTTTNIIQPTQLPGQNLAGWPAIPGAGSLGAVSDSGKCSDGSSKAYSACMAAGLAWNFTPSMSHGATGAEAFLNSPHARFTGTLQQNAQNSPDLSVQLNGTFNSYFTDWGEGIQPNAATGTVTTSSNNGGCTGCHDPHYSTVATATPAPIPMVKQCQDCHTNEGPGQDFSIRAVNHPVGQGTPLPNGLSSADSSPCITCHLAAAAGSATYHYFRINPDMNYYTFGPASVWYANSDTPGNGQPNTYAAEGFANYPAVGLDVDIACGQCHVGGNGSTNTYGIAPAVTTAPAINRADLATMAQNIHAPFVVQVPPSATGTHGQPLGVTITLSPKLNGYFNPVSQSPVTLSVSGLPANATSSFSVNPVTPVNGGAMSTLTITVPATTAKLGPQRHSRPFLALFLPMFGIAVGSVVLGGNRKKRAIWVVLGLALLISLAGAGCGSGSSSSTAQNATAQAFNVTVNATLGATTVTSTIPVTMN